MALQRLQHTGAAPSTSLNGNITSSATAIGVNNGSGYPDGTIGPFVIKIDAGTTTEEKILCSGRSGNTFTVSTNPAGRGYDNTIAAQHNNGAPVEHCYTAAEADDTSDHIYTTTRDDHVQYLRTNGTRTNSGLTGATAASRWVGATTGGPPVSGTFSVGDFAPDQVGGVWVCVTAGSPGTWRRVGASPVVARVHQNAAWSPAGQTTFVYDTVEYDPMGMYSVSTGQFTVPYAGVYSVKASLTVQTDGTHQSTGSAQIYKGAALWTAGPFFTIPVSTTFPCVVVGEIPCAAQDVVFIKPNLSIAAGESGVTGQAYTWATIHYVGSSV